MISTIAVPNRSVGVPLVMIAGICWSTSGLIYRLIENASPWQVLFYRSLALFVMLAIWLTFNYRKNFFSIFSNSIGLSLTGGVCLGAAFTTYILALEYTSVPNAMFILAAAPFITALLGKMILGENVTGITWLCMIVSAVGLGVMVGEEVSLMVVRKRRYLLVKATLKEFPVDIDLLFPPRVPKPFDKGEKSPQN